MNIEDNKPDGTQATEPEERISVAQIAVDSILSRLIEESSADMNSVFAESKSQEPPEISVIASNAEISEGESAIFDIFTRDKLTNSLYISFSINQNGDFLTSQIPSQVHIASNTTKARVEINTQDDQIAESDGFVMLQLRQSDTYKISHQNSATILISDAVDRQLRQDLLTANSRAFLPDVLGNMTIRTTNLISQRVKQGFKESNNITLNLGGQESIRGLIEMSGEITNEGSISWREVLGDSSFAMTLLSGEDLLHQPPFGVSVNIVI